MAVYSTSVNLTESPSMLTVRPGLPDLVKLKASAILLKAANKSIAQAEKTREAAKADISQWLKENREINLEALEIGEIVNVEGICLIERASMDKFDEKSFLLAHADLHAQFKRPLVFSKFKSLVSAE